MILVRGVKPFLKKNARKYNACGTTKEEAMRGNRKLDAEGKAVALAAVGADVGTEDTQMLMWYLQKGGCTGAQRVQAQAEWRRWTWRWWRIEWQPPPSRETTGSRAHWWVRCGREWPTISATEREGMGVESRMPSFNGMAELLGQWGANDKGRMLGEDGRVQRWNMGGRMEALPLVIAPRTRT